MSCAQLLSSYEQRAVIYGENYPGQVHIRILPMTPQAFLERQARVKSVGIDDAFSSLDRFDRRFLTTGAVPDVTLVAESISNDDRRDRVLDKLSCFLTPQQYRMLVEGTKTIHQIASFNRSVIEARIADCSSPTACDAA